MLGHYDDKVNRISFELENYADEQKLFEDVAKVLEILIKNGEVCTFFYEDGGEYIIQHNYANEEYGCEIPKWITQDDWEDFKVWKEEPKEYDFGEEEVKYSNWETRLPFSDVEVEEEDEK